MQANGFFRHTKRKLKQRPTGYKDTILHAVDDFLVHGTKSSERPAPLRLVARDEEVRRQAQTPGHCLDRFVIAKNRVLETGGLTEFLKDG